MIHRDLYVHLWADLSCKHFINKVCWNSRYTFFPPIVLLVCLLFFLFLFSEMLKENNAYVELDDF